MFFAKPPERVLIVSLRFLGDALISSMLAGGIKQKWPNCQVDFLVFEGMQGVLEGNGCVDRVLTLPAKASVMQRIASLRNFWRQYDLAITAQSGDLPHQILWAAARRRIGTLPSNPRHAWWKKRSAPLSVPELPHEHIASRCARLLGQLGIEAQLQVSVPQAQSLLITPGLPLPPAQSYAVLNPCARWTYKRWHSAGWQGLIAHLQQRGLQVVVTGGSSALEKQYLDALLHGQNGLLRFDGQLSFAEAALLLTGAALYVGPDTFTTHLAAACGIPTVALFGPTDPRIWGPLRTISADTAEPYVAVQALQRQANTWLLQNPALPCVPCQQEGCERHQGSASQCLDSLPVAQVQRAVDEILALHGQKPPGQLAAPAA